MDGDEWRWMDEMEWKTMDGDGWRWMDGWMDRLGLGFDLI